MTVVEQLRYYARAMAPSGLGGPGEALASCRRVMLTEAADEIERLKELAYKQADEIERLQDMKARLRVALKPFADLPLWRDTYPDANSDQTLMTLDYITPEMVRAARAACGDEQSASTEMCPRCHDNPVDKALLGTRKEGHVCGKCWQDDREYAGRHT